jgi:hypothetical protein
MHRNWCDGLFPSPDIIAVVGRCGGRPNDVMVSVLAIVPKVRGFKSDQGQDNGFLRAMKIRSAPSFGGEVKPSAPRRMI